MRSSLRSASSSSWTVTTGVSARAPALQPASSGARLRTEPRMPPTPDPDRRSCTSGKRSCARTSTGACRRSRTRDPGLLESSLHVIHLLGREILPTPQGTLLHNWPLLLAGLRHVEEPRRAAFTRGHLVVTCPAAYP